MPMYPHECRDCEQGFEVFATMRETPDDRCPFCDGQGDRVFTVPQVISSEMFKGTKLGLDQFNPKTGEQQMYAQVFRETGADPTGKVYVSGLARFPGDPEALVDNLGDVRRTLHKRGWGCDSLGIKARNDGPPPAPVKLADDIVRQYMAAELDGVPKSERTPKRLAALREKVIDQHSYQPEPVAPSPELAQLRKRVKAKKAK